MAKAIAIRDQRLYREYTDEEGRRLTFEGYCEWRFGITRVHAHRLIEFQYVRENLLPRGNILPDTEYQARPLTKLEPEDQAEAWSRAQEETGKAQPSATEVAKVVAELEKEREARAAAERRSEDWRRPTGYPEIASAISALRRFRRFGGRYRVLGIPRR